MLPAVVIPFSAVGTSARHGEATINRGLSFVADANARCGKRKVPVMVKQLCSSVHNVRFSNSNYSTNSKLSLGCQLL
jgi:hypothetical protein